MLRIDEKVSVLVNQLGEPIGFSWRGASYLVNSKPVRWFARKQWWVDAARVQRGIGAGVLEVEMWRLQASRSESDRAQFELIHNAQSNSWQLARIFN
ncbi:DUF6504 family protein [Rhodoluna sp.]|jgi:hypothetical protein|uniref:DUF6504 family protein n=1 Tax=Rhodoluna sp. TaxID=1969481 RepID=UPI0025D353FB|nr:DUF6504 family protein [Rhodoluna sp.]